MDKPEMTELTSALNHVVGTPAVGTIVLNRPSSHNAITKAMWDELPHMLERLQKQGAQVVVITGRGSSFASGADLLELQQIDGYPSAEEYWNSLSQALEFLWAFQLPTLAMVNGACLGGGCLLSLSCDLRYASSSASFGLPVAKLGIVLDDRNLTRLVNLIGSGFAREMIYLGRTISSTKAAAIGLVNAVVEPEELENVVYEMALQIASNAVCSVQEAKLSINRAVLPNTKPTNQELVIKSYLHDEFKQRIKNYWKD